MADRIARATAKLGFGHFYGTRIVQRNLENLQKCNLYLKDNVKSITVNVVFEEAKHQGGRRFLYEKVPGLRYKNSHVQISVSSKSTLPASITVQFDDGKELTINTSNKSFQDICSEVFTPTIENYQQKELPAVSPKNNEEHHDIETEEEQRMENGA